MRRRRLATLGIMVLVGGAVALFTMGTSHAFPEPPRQHIVMSKVCPPQRVAPSFLVANVTDDQSLSSDKTTWSPETIDAFITVGDNRPADLGGPAGNGYLAKITVLPGETKLVTTSNSVAWQQVFFVHFKVMWRGQLTIFSTKNMCACESAAPAETTTSTSSTSSTTSTSTSTTSTSTTTSTSVPASSTTSSTSSTTSTSTSTTSSSTTTSSSVPESTTTTTEFIIPG